AGDGLSPRHGDELLRLLGALNRASSLREAASSAGLSYRHAWGLLGAGARALGAPLVEMQRGRGARLTAFGRRLLEADARVMLGEAATSRRRQVALRASHDLALPLLARACAPRLDLEISFHGADEC